MSEFMGGRLNGKGDIAVAFALLLGRAVPGLAAPCLAPPCLTMPNHDKAHYSKHALFGQAALRAHRLPF